MYDNTLVKTIRVEDQHSCSYYLDQHKNGRYAVCRLGSEVKVVQWEQRPEILVQVTGHFTGAEMNVISFVCSAYGLAAQPAKDEVPHKGEYGIFLFDPDYVNKRGSEYHN